MFVATLIFRLAPMIHFAGRGCAARLSLEPPAIQEMPILRLSKRGPDSGFCANNKRGASATLLAMAFFTTSANADARDIAMKARRPTFGEGVPAWVVRECRPATGAEMLAKIAGPGEWFYRVTSDFCYLDTRPGVM